MTAGVPLDPRLSFDEVPAVYDRARPEYPSPAFDRLFAHLRERRTVEQPETVEIGPATGHATRALLARVGRVMAVKH